MKKMYCRYQRYNVLPFTEKNIEEKREEISDLALFSLYFPFSFPFPHSTTAFLQKIVFQIFQYVICSFIWVWQSRPLNTDICFFTPLSTSSLFFILQLATQMSHHSDILGSLDVHQVLHCALLMQQLHVLLCISDITAFVTWIKMFCLLSKFLTRLKG